MDNLIDIVDEIKHKLTSQEYLDLNNNIMEVYKTKAIIIKEDGSNMLTSKQQTNIYNETSFYEMEEWEQSDILEKTDLEKDETLM
jgi:hypothetical protein